MTDLLRGSDLSTFYAQHGFAGRIGFGERPALIVIDMARAWLDPSSPIGTDFGDLVERIGQLVQSARRAAIPVFYTTMPYPAIPSDLVGVWARKLPHAAALEGAKWSEIDPRVDSRPEEVIVKNRASAFYGTILLSRLVSLQVDTLLVTGCSTSGCVRSTAESAFNVGLHSIVVGDCVGDRSPAAHEANLIDIDSRYADVVLSERVHEYLEAVWRTGGGTASTPETRALDQMKETS
jgi:nicotinamidase-related amidase